MLAVGAGCLSVLLPALAQQQGNRPPRVGFLNFIDSNLAVTVDPFREGMRELGHVEGKTYVLEVRTADGKPDRLPALAAELVRLKVDVIVAVARQGIRAAQQATNAIPIVFGGAADPIGSGYAKSLARPGGNMTGVSLMSSDLDTKRLELLKTIMPRLSRVAVLVYPQMSAHLGLLKNIEPAARQLRVTILQIDASTPEEIERGFAAMRREHADAVIVPVDPFFFSRRQQIADLALKHRMASVFAYREPVEAGGLMGYGYSIPDAYRRAATYVDKILKGTRPGDLPIEQPTRFELTINRKTAKALGLTIPQELLLRADEVITESQGSDHAKSTES